MSLKGYSTIKKSFKLKVGLSPFEKVFFGFNGRSVKHEKHFLFHVKLILFSNCLNFCSDFFVHVRNQFDKSAKVNFKTFYIANWETNHYNCPTGN